MIISPFLQVRLQGGCVYAHGGGVEYAAKAARPRRGEQGKKPPLLDCAGPKRSIASRQPALRARHVVRVDFFYKKIIKEAHKYLVSEGYLCLEIGYNQKDEVIKLIEKEETFKNIYSKKDLYGIERIIIAEMK